MIEIFHQTSQQCSKIITRNYSTSFYSAIKLLHKDLQPHIYNIYGLVRYADEIVDTFHSYDKAGLLSRFCLETQQAIAEGISLNPVLHSFQLTVNKYRISPELIDAFFYSMEQDLFKKNYTRQEYSEYIFGSAEVVGLMCLQVFCEGDKLMYDNLKAYARHLGAAFQKVNFLRDIKADFEGLNRLYFPNCSFDNFTQADKQSIEADIENDFKMAFKGITLLPLKARLGVYIAYKYYLSLFKKIKKLQPESVLRSRIRISDYSKMFILAKAGFRNQINLL